VIERWTWLNTHAAPIHVKTIALVHPIAPKKGAYTGHKSAVVDILEDSGGGIGEEYRFDLG